MCGIIGLLSGKNSPLTPSQLKSTTSALFKLSQSRGQESSGLALYQPGTISIYKRPLPARQLLKDPNYHQLFSRQLHQPTTIIGHARLVTNGSLKDNHNNQPVNKDGLVIVHNGIITNHFSLWRRHPSLQRLYQVDTEIIASLLGKLATNPSNLPSATAKTFKLLEGSASIAALFCHSPQLLLATNTGSLYYARSRQNLIFASERYILKSTISKLSLKTHFPLSKLTQLKPNTALLVNTSTAQLTPFTLTRSRLRPLPAPKTKTTTSITDLSPPSPPTKPSPFTYKKLPSSLTTKYLSSILPAINALKRCTRCILPQTMPFITFDSQSVCNFCRHYQKHKILGKSALLKTISKYRPSHTQPNCLVAFSGGRDSSYGLHYIKNQLNLNPIAFSYDWGMISDLARRNQARLTGALGVEHMLVSANIRQKRANIRNNVLAWLKKPDLGTVPLFMAGDKQFFYHNYLLGKQTGIKLFIWCDNPFEKTHFKSGFSGIPPALHQGKIHIIPTIDKIRLAFYYLKHFATNPAYLNSSLINTASAFLSYYLLPHNFISLYHYVRWRESSVNSTIINRYHWERAPDTNSTWRIGDGTAPFYNYIYFTLAGFSENDSFRSNQIREGMLTRAQALKLVSQENQPRYQSLQWYCDTINLSLKDTLGRINSLPKLYRL